MPTPGTYVNTESLRRHQNLIKAIKALTKKEKHPPTVRELGDYTGRNISSVHRDLKILKEQGQVTWEENKPRTLRALA